MAMLVQDQNNFLIDVEKNQLKSNLSKDLEAYHQLNWYLYGEHKPFVGLGSY